MRSIGEKSVQYKRMNHSLERFSEISGEIEMAAPTYSIGEAIDEVRLTRAHEARSNHKETQDNQHDTTTNKLI